MSQIKLTTAVQLFALLFVGCTATTPPLTAPASLAPTIPASVHPIEPTRAVSATLPAPAVPSTGPSETALAPATNPNPTSTPTASYSWAKLTPPAAPPPRYDHAIALDTENRQLVLFGGRAGGHVFGDTWLYDLESNEWREIETPGPSPRFGFASVYDHVSRAVYLFGGQEQEFFNDTWKFDTVAQIWSEIETKGDKPDIRYGHGVTLDTKNNRLVISHGFARYGRHNDTWALDLAASAWTELTPPGDKPLNRCLHDIAYAPASNLVYLFGGCSSGFGPCPQGDLWALDLETDQWTMANPVGEIPSARENPSIVVDSNTGNLILFGGKAEGNVNDTWMFDPSTKSWSQITSKGPTARKSHDAVFDPSGKRMFLFGGSTGDGAANDLWVLQQN